MDGVNDVAQNIHKNHVTLITSVISKAEILESTLDSVARQKLDAIFKRRNVVSVAADDRVMKLAHAIRDYYQQQKPSDGLPTVTTPDAIHLATAIHYEASELQTFDEKNIPGKRRALIPLSGNVAGHNLLVRKPPIPPQQRLFPNVI